MSEKTCPGYCCRCFLLPHGMEQFKQGRAELEATKADTYRLVGNFRDTDATLPQLVWLTENLIELGTDYDTFPQFNKPRLVGSQPKNVIGSDPSRYFTCKQYNVDTHHCNDYENRPDFCRSYPESYGLHTKCPFEGCTHKHNDEVDKRNSEGPHEFPEFVQYKSGFGGEVANAILE